MLNVKQIKTYIIEAAEEFKEMFPNFEPPKVVVVPSSRR